MFRHFITGINYAKLISMQANQESFAPHAISRKAQLKIENKKVTLTFSVRQDEGTNGIEHQGAYNLGNLNSFIRFSFENAQHFDRIQECYLIAKKLIAILTSTLTFRFIVLSILIIILIKRIIMSILNFFYFGFRT